MEYEEAGGGEPAAVEPRPSSNDLLNLLSPSMRKVVTFAKKHGGKIRRYQGGFWANPERFEHPTFGTTTIEALVKRNVMFYSEWKENRSGSKFPVEATLTGLV